MSGKATARKRYSVTLRRDPGSKGIWLADVAELPGCHSWGRGLRQTRKRVRQAIGAWLGDDDVADQAELRERLPLPATIARELEEVDQLVERADRLQGEMEAASRSLQQHRQKVIRKLGGSANPWSVRDLAELLGLSSSRVGQLQGPRGGD